MGSHVRDRCALTLLGIGAMASERFAPAGLLVEHRGEAVMIDGGPGAAPRGQIRSWLVTDERCELIAAIRRLARQLDVEPHTGTANVGGVAIEAHPVVHTSRTTYGYRIRLRKSVAVWAPEFFEFPKWAAGATIMFADAAAWNRPIRFAGGVGGHAAALDVAEKARALNVGRLVFAHVGRPTIRALDSGSAFPHGELGEEGRVYELS
jgi:hypothetical protein